MTDQVFTYLLHNKWWITYVQKVLILFKVTITTRYIN